MARLRISPNLTVRIIFIRTSRKAAHKREHIHAEGVKEPVHAEKHMAKEKSDKKSQGLLGRMSTGRARSRSGMGGGAGPAAKSS